MRLAVAGAGGRMGRALIKAIGEREGLTLAAAIERAGSPHLGTDAGELAGSGRLGVPVSADLSRLRRPQVDGIVDFTAPAVSVSLAKLAAASGLVHVIGTTGFAPAEDADVKLAAEKAAIVKSGNMSVGINLLAALTEKVAAILGPDFDIEILEMHHRHKVDAPSGTALLLGNAAATGRGIDLAGASVRSRDGHTGPRPSGAIGFATLRGGSVVGEHSVIFAGEGERIELQHKAEDRQIFALGALRAALWALGRPPGLYSMRDVLGL